MYSAYSSAILIMREGPPYSHALMEAVFKPKLVKKYAFLKDL